jgi:hypothetical protein
MDQTNHQIYLAKNAAIKRKCKYYGLIINGFKKINLRLIFSKFLSD